MSKALFFHLVAVPVQGKATALAAEIAGLNDGYMDRGTYEVDIKQFTQIPGSPFAYWVLDSVRNLFKDIPPLQTGDRRVCFGLSTKNDFQFVRLYWESRPRDLANVWFAFVKGGAFSPYYYDVHLLIDWEAEGRRLKAFANKRTQELFGTASWSRWINNWGYYFRPGLTWPRRTNGFSVRVLPAGCIFADKGPALFVHDDNHAMLLALLSLLNSSIFAALVRVQLARTELAQSYEVGLIQSTPVPPLDSTAQAKLAALAGEAHELQRELVRHDETTHVFGLSALAMPTAPSLLAATTSLEAQRQAIQIRLNEVRKQIDEIAFDLYGLNEADRTLIQTELGQPPDALSEASVEEGEADSEDEEAAAPEDLPLRVQNLLMWCVGVAFGRWDVRMALDPTLLPALQGPFDPLPRCAPGALVGADGLPPARPAQIAPEAWLRARRHVLDLPPAPQPQSEPAHYPLEIAWDGILVDDPDHPADLVGRVRQVLRLLWGERADAIEQEACAILGFADLRSYFRDPRRGFYAFHIKRYSKSRRKAPIYWLLQSERRSYGIWLYYHRIRATTLYEAARKPYADSKVLLEETRLEELRQELDSLSGAARKRREREIERQVRLVAEVTAFRDTLDRAAALNLPVDHNDGVILSIAPLHTLTPWREAAAMWRELMAGKYEWSAMAQNLRKRGLLNQAESR